MSLEGKRVLVTGGTGFLGRHVCRKLAEVGAVAYSFGSAAFELTHAPDCEKMFNSVEGGYHAVIHLAANCGGIGHNQAWPMLLMRENLAMGMNVLEQCHLHDCKLLIVGTVCSYPSNTPVPFKESDLWNGYPEPTNAPYGIAKKTVMELALAYHRECGLNVVNLILANLYGPGDNFDLETSHVIPAMVRQFVDSECWYHREFWGDGTPTRDFLYVEDAADAIVRALDVHDAPAPLNIGTGIETSIRDVASKIREITGSSATFSFDKHKPNGQMRRCLDISKAKAALDWKPQVSLERGLDRTVEWYKQNKGEA